MFDSSYDYKRRQGILPVSWEEFHGICRALAVAVSPFAPEMILPIARGGLYPGALLSHILQVEVYPVRVSRRVNDVVTHERPQWLLQPPDAVKGRRVLVVDEISSSGETISVVKGRVEEMGASAVRTAVLYAHSSGAGVPDYTGIISDALIVNPWDREILKQGVFEVHPEYVDGLSSQGMDVQAMPLVNAPGFKLAKG